MSTQQSIITDELRAVIGIKSEPHMNEIERSAIRKYAEAIQDPNPLYVDDAYARKTPHGGIIAPPTFPCTLRAGDTKMPIPIPPTHTEGLNGGVEYVYERPIRLYDRLVGTNQLVDVFEKDGRLGRMLFLVGETAFEDQDGSLVARTVETTIRYAKPESSAKVNGAAAPASMPPPRTAADKNPEASTSETSRPGTAPDALDEITRLRPRYFEDIEEGQELPSLLKQPTQRHLVMYAGASGNFAEYHYDRDHALGLGMPGVILHGNLKIAYLGQVVTDWIGAHGTVLKLGAQVRGMDLLGDVCLVQSIVTRKAIEEGRGIVEFELWTEAPNGKRTTVGSATVALPHR